jgi:hypothetical protein
MPLMIACRGHAAHCDFALARRRMPRLGLSLFAIIKLHTPKHCCSALRRFRVLQPARASRLSLAAKGGDAGAVTVTASVHRAHC